MRSGDVAQAVVTAVTIVTQLCCDGGEQTPALHACRRNEGTFDGGNLPYSNGSDQQTPLTDCRDVVTVI